MNFLGKLIKIIFWLLIIWFLTKDFYYINFTDNCAVVIVPSFLEFNNKTVKDGISILKHASPNNYQDLCKNVSVINPNPNCGGYSGGCFYYNQPKNIYANISKNNPSITSAVLVHEVCHLLQYKSTGTLNEEECYKKDSDLLGKIVEL